METYQSPKGDWQPRQPVDLAGLKRVILMAVLAVLVLVGVFSSYYTVDTEEQAVVLRFGQYKTTTDPGLHFKAPFGIDQAIKVPVAKVNKLEFGFSTRSAGVRTQYAKRSAEEEEASMMLTGDLNIADVEWVVQFRIKDARDYVFNVREQESAVRDLSEAVMRVVVGDHTITEVLTTQRDLIKNEASRALQIAVDAYQLGVKIETVELQNVNPPAEVRESFNAVNSAQQERSRMENDAEKVRNELIPKARGEAEQAIEEAQGYAIDRVNRAKGDIARFVQMLAIYDKTREVTRQRLFLETVERVLPKVNRIVIASEDGVLKILPVEGERGGVR